LLNDLKICFNAYMSFEDGSSDWRTSLKTPTSSVFF